MSVLDDLPSGRRGVRFTVPPELESIATDERPDVLYAPDRSIAWQFFVNQLPIDARPQHRELLLRDAHRCARDVFINYSSTLEQIRPLRTDDPTWSPLVEITPTQLRGAPILTAIHRMSYQPGNEFVMGHLLVPIRAGLFELRLLARADMTGVRESMLVAPVIRDAAAAGEDPIAAAQRLKQPYFDDPAHDARFPDHPLSRIRSALAWVLERSDLEVTEPAEPPDDGELVFDDLGYAFVPPPRYLKVDIGNPYLQFARFSFTPTDGVHELSVHRHRHPIPARSADAVERLARRLADECAMKGYTDFTVDTTLDDPDHARVLLCYTDHSGPRHTTHHVFRCPDGTVLLPIIDAPRSTPAAELDAEIAAMLATLRPLAPAAAKRPWWRFWN
jgi:hypothetical protein